MQDVLNSLPFNLSLLILQPEHLKGLRPVKVLDIFEAGSTNFHPDGLFSVEIFGKVGDERRNRLFAYIELGIDILHPLIYKKLLDIREFYGKIMDGTAYAVFNKQTKDFEPSNLVEGRTGYAFFMEHFHELQFEERPSTSREFAIKLINKYRNNATLRQFLVMPAGLRDFYIEPNGKKEEDEINTLYRQVLSISNIMIASKGVKDKSHLDSSRIRLQQATLAIYQYIIGMLEGDNKLIQGHWTNRNLFITTRNVITATVSKSKTLYDEVSLGPNDLVVGLYQYIRGVFPVFVKYLRSYAEQVFIGPNSPARLVNMRTLSSEQVSVVPEFYDEWITQEGIESLLNRFESEYLRHEPIVISGYYFGLLYQDEKSFKFFQGMEDFPEHLDKKKVKPITYAELFYIAIQPYSRDSYGLTTRYPVINLGGIHPVKIYLRSTTKSKIMRLRNESWEITEEVFNEFPVRGVSFVNSMSPPAAHLGRLGADFDGDMMNLDIAMTSDAIEEIKSLLNSKNYYVGIDGRMNYSVANDVSNLVFAELSE